MPCCADCGVPFCNGQMMFDDFFMFQHFTNGRVICVQCWNTLSEAEQITYNLV